MKLTGALPNNIKGRAIASQLMRSGTSVAANYRAACRGRSLPEFMAKLGTVEEEADESALWLELIIADNLLETQRVQSLLDEANQLVAIMVASRKSAARTHSQIKNRKSKIP